MRWLQLGCSRDFVVEAEEVVDRDGNVGSALRELVNMMQSSALRGGGEGGRRSWRGRQHVKASCKRCAGECVVCHLKQGAGKFGVWSWQRFLVCGAHNQKQEERTGVEVRETLLPRKEKQGRVFFFFFCFFFSFSFVGFGLLGG